MAERHLAPDLLRPTRRLLLLALVLLFAACGGPPKETAPGTASPPRAEPSAPSRAAEPAPEAEGIRIVFLGDSLSAGLGLSEDQAFPALVGVALRARGWAVEVVNAGVSGDTTAGGRSRIDWVLRQNPDILVLELGGNDGLRGLPPERTEENLRRMIEKCREAEVRVLLLGMRLPPNYGPEYVSAFEAIYPRLAGQTGVAYVPFFLQEVAGRPELNQPDGIHPNAEGHRLAAEALVPVVEGLVAEVASQ